VFVSCFFVCFLFVFLVFCLGVAWGSQEKIKIAVSQHAGDKLVDKWPGLDEEVTEHGVRFPAAQEVDHVWVNVSAEEGHGPTSSKGAGRDVVGGKSHGVVNCGGGHVEGCHDVFGEDATPALVGVIIGCQGDIQWRLVVAVV